MKNKPELRSTETLSEHRSGTVLETIISDVLVPSPVILLNPYFSFNLLDRKK